ncbi:MAG: hypothetical protein MI866_09995 [Bacteroidales bacterium]|nr:hypothetical protein [Bacteroidales bacterium]
MKTSKIILIAFLSVFCLSLLSFLITVDGINIKRHSEQLETKTEDLPDFRFVKVLNGSNVRLKTSSTNKLTYSHKKDSIINNVYEISADTLILKPLKSDHYTSEYIIELSKTQEIINKGGTLRVGLTQDSIFITNKEKGSLYISRHSSINNIQLNSQTRAETIISATGIQQLIMNVSHSNVTINKDIHSVNLIANNSSRVTLQSVKSLVVECDSTSEFNVY